MKLQAAGTGIGKGSWLRWEGLCKRFTVPAVVAMAESLPSCDRNAWTIEAAIEEMSKGRTKASTPAVTDADREITAIIRHHGGWKAALKASEIGGVINDEATLREVLTHNAPARQSMFADIGAQA